MIVGTPPCQEDTENVGVKCGSHTLTTGLCQGEASTGHPWPSPESGRVNRSHRIGELGGAQTRTSSFLAQNALSEHARGQPCWVGKKGLSCKVWVPLEPQVRPGGSNCGCASRVLCGLASCSLPVRSDSELPCGGWEG